MTGKGTAAERLASTMRTIASFASAVGEGIRARNEYFEQVGHGADPVKAAAEAVRHAEVH